MHWDSSPAWGVCVCQRSRCRLLILCIVSKGVGNEIRLWDPASVESTSTKKFGEFVKPRIDVRYAWEPKIVDDVPNYYLKFGIAPGTCWHCDYA